MGRGHGAGYESFESDERNGAAVFLQARPRRCRPVLLCTNTPASTSSSVYWMSGSILNAMQCYVCLRDRCERQPCVFHCMWSLGRCCTSGFAAKAKRRLINFKCFEQSMNFAAGILFLRLTGDPSKLGYHDWGCILNVGDVFPPKTSCFVDCIIRSKYPTRA